MNKKSIGQFIAALRKANGLTQKTLAEKLNVSDKSVSRWERDECAPDLSLIPVIAEIFGVSSDEILRGERKTQDDDSAEPSTRSRTEKQLERLVNETQARFVNRSLIAGAVGVTGLLAAMICNFGFHRAYVGFFVGCIVYLAAVTCETIFTRLAFSAVRSSDFVGEKVDQCRKRLFYTAAVTYGILLLQFAVTLPLITLPLDAYAGLTAGSWLTVSVIYAAGAAAVGLLCTVVVNELAMRRGLFGEVQITEQIKLLKKRAALVLLILLSVTLAGHCASNVLTTSGTFAGKKVFTNLNEFKSYITTSVGRADNAYSDSAVVGVPRGDGPMEYIYDEEGNPVCQYIQRNEDVVRIETKWKDGQPVVSTWASGALIRGAQIRELLNVCFVFLYISEVSTILIFYLIKMKKLSRADACKKSPLE